MSLQDTSLRGEVKRRGGQSIRMGRGGKSTGKWWESSTQLVRILLLVGWFIGSCSGVCRPSDESALLNFKSGVLDYANRLYNWRPGTDCCYWQAVSCTPDRTTVKQLLFDSLQADRSKPGVWEAALTNLTGLTDLLLGIRILGPFPLGLTRLPNLISLTITGCHILGPIPPEIGNLRNLQVLSIDSEPGLRGPIPEEIGRLHSLLQLYISYNSGFAAAIPQGFCNLTTLTYIQIVSSPITAIPNCFDQFPNLSVLSIDGTNISHPFPDSIGKLPLLETLYVRASPITGSIPDIFDNFPNLGFLDLSYNQLTGTLPKSLGKLTSVVNLWINNNMIHGSVPDLSKLARLTDLELMNNQLSGQLPTSVQTLSTLNYLLLDNNSFSGQIPPDFSNFCNIGMARQCTISLTHNQLSGPIPPRFLNFTNYNSTYGAVLQAFIDISFNRISGPIPHNVGVHLQTFTATNNFLSGGYPLQLAYAQFVDLSNNHLDDASQTGELPADYYNNPNPIYKEIRLANNKFKGPFPTWFSLLNNLLANLDISCNTFWGPLPDSIYDSAGMQKLNVSHNYFWGPLPTHPFKSTPFPTVIDVLDLHHNYFSGQIAPSFFTSIKIPGGVNILDLSENRLSGPLPKEIGIVGSGPILLGSFPERIDLSHNFLSGPIPPEIGNLTYIQYLDLSNNHFTGTVPASLGRLVVNERLRYLDLSANDIPFPIK